MLLGRYAKEQQRLTQTLGRPPSPAELAEALGTTVDQVEELEELRQQPLSLDAPVADHGRVADVVADPRPIPAPASRGCSASAPTSSRCWTTWPKTSGRSSAAASGWTAKIREPWTPSGSDSA